MINNSKEKSVSRFSVAIGLFFAAFLLLAVAQSISAKEKNTRRDSYMILLESNSVERKESEIVKLKVFKGYQLYSVPFKNKGKKWYSLRLGFFADRESANETLKEVRRTYKDAWVNDLPSAKKGGFARYAVGALKKPGLIERFKVIKAKVTAKVKSRAKNKTPADAKSAIETKFNHFDTGFPLSGRHDTISCDSCHSGGVFKGTPERCVDCHRRGGSVKASSKSLSHVYTEVSCSDCHSEIGWFIALRMDHSSIRGTCSSCHNGVTAKARPGTHIRTSAPCDDCHGTSTWATSRFDHGSITDSCSTCHNGATATGKGGSHIQTTAACDDCHSPAGWTSINFDHSSVSGSCSSCHNGTNATGKTPRHISSTNFCDACHSTNSWLNIAMDHGAVSGTCASCHNGVAATGKSATHIATPAPCDSCHTTNNWLSTTFDHSAVSGNCSSCHNGVAATGKSATHIATSAPCDDCHTTTSWMTANFNHASVTGSCSTCHNGVAATGKLPTHFVTSVQCDECHSTTGWIPTTAYRHSSGNYPGDHRSYVLCLDCHTSNTQTATWRNSGYKPDCAGCHANDYKASKHKKISSTSIYYTVSELRNCAGSCHRYTDASLTTIAKNRSSKHRTSAGGF